jgi:hypothetical protein
VTDNNDYIKRKALVVRSKPEMDVGDIVQIGHNEGKKLFQGRSVKVVDLFRRSETEFVVVVQGPEGVSGRKAESK